MLRYVAAVATVLMLSQTGSLFSSPQSSSLRAGPAIAAVDGRIAMPGGGAVLRLPDGTVHRVTSLLETHGPMRYGDFVWRDDAVRSGPVWVRVDVSRQILSVFSGGDEIGTSVILYGADEARTPLGVFKVLSKSADHVSSTYDAPMPYTLRLTSDGVSIHGSDVRVGRVTHGCIGVPVEFARRLFERMAKGDAVAVVA